MFPSVFEGFNSPPPFQAQSKGGGELNPRQSKGGGEIISVFSIFLIEYTYYSHGKERITGA